MKLTLREANALGLVEAGEPGAVGGCAAFALIGELRPEDRPEILRKMGPLPGRWFLLKCGLYERFSPEARRNRKARAENARLLERYAPRTQPCGRTPEEVERWFVETYRAVPLEPDGSLLRETRWMLKARAEREPDAALPTAEEYAKNVRLYEVPEDAWRPLLAEAERERRPRGKRRPAAVPDSPPRLTAQFDGNGGGGCSLSACGETAIDAVSRSLTLYRGVTREEIDARGHALLLYLRAQREAGLID